MANRSTWPLRLLRLAFLRLPFLRAVRLLPFLRPLRPLASANQAISASGSSAR